MERDSLPLQPRVRRPRADQPGDRFACTANLVVAARPRLRHRGFVVQLDRMGDRRRIQGPDRPARSFQPALVQTEARDRLGRIAGWDHHRRPGPDIPRPLRGRDPTLRCARGRRGHMEHRTRRRLRLQDAPRARTAITAAGQHHKSRRQPAGREVLLQPGGANAGGPGRIRLDRRPRRPAGWIDPTAPQPAPTDYAAQEAAQARWESEVDFPFEFQYRAELEQRAGGNPSWNTGVDYTHQLAISSNSAEVTALYSAAGLDLAADIRALNSGTRISADPKAVAYLDRFVSFDGNLSVPVLTMHTIGDGLVVPQDETAYGDVVRAAGRQDLLRQVFVHRAGHCAFSAAETITAIDAMIARLDAGSWGAQLSPADLNTVAQALGDTYNAVGGFFTSPPAFENFA